MTKEIRERIRAEKFLNEASAAELMEMSGCGKRRHTQIVRNINRRISRKKP